MTLKTRIVKLEKVSGAKAYQTPAIEMYENLFTTTEIKLMGNSNDVSALEWRARIEREVTEIVQTGVLPDAISTLDDWRGLAREWQLPCVMGEA